MTSSLTCPTCTADLVSSAEGGLRCQEGHHYTVTGLALTNNIASLRALWLAIRALEDDAAGLKYMAGAHGDGLGESASARLSEADAALDAAQVLRGHAERAQQRLDALPDAPTADREDGSQKGRGG